MYPHSRPRRPYVPIDTCSPGGTWIEEKRYNKVRRESTSNRSRKVLCGNWQEEKSLEDDLLTQPRSQPVEETSAVLHASLDAILRSETGRFTGGHRSTPYLTRDARQPHAHWMETTHRHDYCAANADITRMQRAALGVRSRVLLSHVMDAAKREKAAADATRLARATHTALDGREIYLSTYHVHHCREEEMPVVEVLEQSYLADVPITLYTGNPTNGKTMTVHGKTPTHEMEERSKFGRHTYFTDPKYAL